MRQTGTGLDDAGPAMLAMRSALLLTSGMDVATEPIPLCGQQQRGSGRTVDRHRGCRLTATL